MKPKLFFLIFFTAILSDGFGQAIQVDCDDYVGIGVTPVTGIQLYVSGVTYTLSDDIDFVVEDDYIKFKHGDATRYIYFGEYSDHPIFYPTVTNNGYLGRSGYQFYEIRGYNVYYTNLYSGSDSRLKENIRTLDSPLQKIMNVRGVKYDFISDQDSLISESQKIEMEKMDKDKIGFIAQELIEVYPELVNYDEKNDEYSVSYIEMIPVLVEAIKEQQGMIESLQAKIDASNLKSSSTLTNVTELPLVNSSTLYQNNPNPFNEDTEIKFDISEDVITSTLIVYDMQGTQIRSYNIPERGSSSVIIYGHELDPGMYMYSLIVDGKEVGTKRMILTD
jgi:hypothetical protein